ncbi:MAG: DUF3052 family protein [Acidobacteria bacterium]|nr:DUF3052 family protein [Acidobacteriota bacterium]
MAPYSKRPLVEKLGVRPGSKILKDFIHYFTKERKHLENMFHSLKASLAPAGVLWVSWPKRASKVFTDLNENAVRDIAVAHGLVDVKVCAVDNVWSGLKLVYRLRDRPKS